MSSSIRPRIVGVLAFYQRALGLHRRSVPFQDLARRSRRALKELDRPAESLRFQISLRQLRSDWDLLTDEAMSDDDALRLRVRVLELAGEFSEAESLIRPDLGEAPLSRVFAIVLAEARAQDAREVELQFGTPHTGTIRAILRTRDREKEVANIPWELEESLRGLLRFVEKAGFAKVRPYLDRPQRLPEDMALAWSGADRLTITLR